MLLFYTPLKTPDDNITTSGFLMFSGGIEVVWCFSGVLNGNIGQNGLCMNYKTK